jgi:Flp pilus assembly protein TadD
VLLVLGLAACGAPAPQTSSRPQLFAAEGGVQPLPTLTQLEAGSTAGDFLAGNFALEHGEIDEAAQFFGRAVAIDDDPELRQRAFLLRLAANQTEAALADAERLADVGTPSEEADLLLGLRDARAGSFGSAATRFDALPPDGLGGLVRPFLSAWAEYGRDDPAAARDTLASVDDSFGALRTYHLAMIDALEDDPEAAETKLGEVVAEPATTPPRMVRALAAVLTAQGERDAAADLLRAAMENGSDPELEAALAELEAGRAPQLPVDGPTTGMADSLLAMAEALERQRAGLQALFYARLAGYVSPGFPEAALIAAEIFASQANYDLAIAAYDEVPAASPLSWQARLGAAQAVYASGQTEAAKARFQAMADERPERTEALITLGDLLRRDELYAEAEPAYTEAIVRIGTLESQHWPLLYSRGIAYERTQRWDQAEEDFLQALELEPEQPLVLNYLGYSWIDRGEELERAEGMIKRAVEQRPNDGFIVDSLGWIYFLLGRYDEAVAQLERAIELEPGDPVINDHLGDAYWRVGREREARFQWRRALSLDPDEDLEVGIEAKLTRGLPDDERSTRG